MNIEHVLGLRKALSCLQWMAFAPQLLLIGGAPETLARKWTLHELNEGIQGNLTIAPQTQFMRSANGSAPRWWRQKSQTFLRYYRDSFSLPIGRCLPGRTLQ